MMSNAARMSRLVRFVAASIFAFVVCGPAVAAPASAAALRWAPIPASTSSAVQPIDATNTQGSHTAVTSTMQTPFASILAGSVVTFTLSGYQPDFDPIDRVIISAHLKTPASAGHAVPPTLAVFYLYLENFQPTTTPLLPDLLHPNQQASNLGGFLSGKMSLIDATGHEQWRGGVLAEVFLDNSVHMIVDAFRPNNPNGPTQRLTSIFTLHKDLTVTGDLNARKSLALGPAATSTLRFPSWQSVVNTMTVKKPSQYGLTDKHLLPPTPGAVGNSILNAAPTATAVAAPATSGQGGSSSRAPILLGAAAVLIVLAAGCFALLLRAPSKGAGDRAKRA